MKLIFPACAELEIPPPPRRRPRLPPNRRPPPKLPLPTHRKRPGPFLGPHLPRRAPRRPRRHALRRRRVETTPGHPANLPLGAAHRGVQDAHMAPERRGGDGRRVRRHAEARLERQAAAERRPGHNQLSADPAESGQRAECGGGQAGRGGLGRVLSPREVDGGDSCGRAGGAEGAGEGGAGEGGGGSAAGGKGEGEGEGEGDAEKAEADADAGRRC